MKFLARTSHYTRKIKLRKKKFQTKLMSLENTSVCSTIIHNQQLVSKHLTSLGRALLVWRAIFFENEGCVRQTKTNRSSARGFRERDAHALESIQGRFIVFASGLHVHANPMQTRCKPGLASCKHDANTPCTRLEYCKPGCKPETRVMQAPCKPMQARILMTSSITFEL